MQHKVIEQWEQLFQQSLADPVKFAENLLLFKPYPYQVQFLRDSSPRIVASCGRQVGKTTLTAIKALHYTLSHPSVTVLIVSAGLRQSINLFDKILNFIDICLPAKLLCRNQTRTRIQFRNGSEIIALPCGSEGSTLRGYTSDLVIVDEANFIPRTVIDSVLRPTMITRPAQMIMISTPWTTDHPFYEALNNPDLGFKSYIWPTRMNPQATPERLELERITIGDLAFDREYNAKFLDNQFAYFSTDLVLNCTKDYEPNNDQTQPQPGNYHIGVDFAKLQDHSAIAILQKKSESSIHLVYIKEFPLNTPYTTVIDHVSRLHQAYHFLGGYVDQNGVGEALYEQIKKFTTRIKGVNLTVQSKEDILGKLKLAMERKIIAIPGSNKTLLTQITSQQCKLLPSGNLQFTHPTGAHDDQLWALALANYAIKPEPCFDIAGAKRKGW